MSFLRFPLSVNTASILCFSLQCCPAMSRREIWRILFILFLGQLLSFSVAVTSFASSLLADLGVDTPLTQSFFTYLLLAVVYGALFLYRRQKLLVPWYWYIALAFVDVQANYLVVKAYQYSSITSVTLLDCSTIPWVLILTWFVLGTRYSLWQFLGAAICVIGLGLVLLSDAGVSGGGGKKPLLGDVLVIAGTMCYSFSNVGEEFCVKMKDRVEVVMMLGVFGVLLSVCEISIFERKDLESVKWSTTIICLFAGFAASTFLFYNITPFVLKVDWLYYFAFGVVAIGLIMYSLTEPNSVTSTINGDEEVNHHSEPLIEENSSSRNESFTS